MKMLIEGTISKFKERTDSMFFQAAQGEKKAFASFKVNVVGREKQKDQNGKDGKYNVQQIFILKAWGRTAEMMNERYNPGDKIVCWADFNKIDTYVDKKTGQIIPSGIEVWVSELAAIPSFVAQEISPTNDIDSDLGKSNFSAPKGSMPDNLFETDDDDDLDDDDLI